MKKNKIKDERIEMTTNKIYKEAYFVLFILLLVAIFYKSYIKSMPLESYISEVCILVISVIYVAVRGMMLGSGLMNGSKKGTLLNLAIPFLLSCIVAALNGIRNYSQYGDKYSGILDGHFIAVLVVSFGSSFLFLSVCFWVLGKLQKTGEQKLDKYIEEEDDDE